nr:translation initiation factor 2 [Streptomyces hygroscopicus]
MGRRATGDGRRATGDGQRATGNGRRATGNGQRATGNGRRATGNGQRATGKDVLFAARSANALYRLIDVLPVFAGDDRINRLFTLVPGSDFGMEALAAVERAGAHTVPWEQACQHSYDLILAASPKGELGLLSGPRVLLPHGAGFNKSVRGEGSDHFASGLDPAFLAPDGRMVASCYALAHPSQVTRLAAVSPQAAACAAVVGDPTLERILASRSRRDHYREALGTGARKLIVLTSTWGPESLLRRRPTLPADLAAKLAHDAYQLALIVHPNEHSRIGTFDLSEHLAPAIDAGMILPRPHEEWAAVLIAADAVITDHGSTALYAAALGRPLIAAYDGGHELLPGSPMAQLLDDSPRLDAPGGLEAVLAAHRPEAVQAFAAAAFAQQGQALTLLREKLYRLLTLTPPPSPATARLLPAPAPPTRTPAAFAVDITVSDEEVRVERFPAHRAAPAHHLAVEHGTADERHAQSASLLYRRASRGSTPHKVAWSVSGWTRHTLADYPGCATAAVVLSPALCVVRTRSGSLLSVRIEPCRESGRIVYTDPAAVLSAVHAWLAMHPAVPVDIRCVVGEHSFQVRLTPATTLEGEPAC